MSLDLGKAHWKLVGVVGGRALFTHWSEQRSRWVDLNAWPGTLETAREEWTRAVCDGAVLVGWKQQTVYVGKREQIALPTKKHGYRAIGTIGKRVVVVPGHLGMDNKSSPLTVAAAPRIHDGAWRELAGSGGADTPHAAVVGTLVIWGGRVLRFDGDALHETDAGDLPPVHPNIDPGHVPTDDGFITVGGGKLVTVSRAGKQRDDKRVGQLALVNVQPFEDGLLLFDNRHYYRYDGTTHARIDLGVTREIDALIAAPCGLVALVDSSRMLVRVRP